MQGDPMRQEKLMVIPAEAASAGVQIPHLTSLTSLSGTAAWGPHGERTLNFNHHLETHKLVPSPGSTTSTRIAWLRHLAVQAAPKRPPQFGAESKNQTYPDGKTQSGFALNREL